MNSSNMLYPKEDEINQQLMFACKSCHYSERADSTCVFRNALKEEIAETAGNTDDVEDDPTVGNNEDFYNEHPSYRFDSAMLDTDGEDGEYEDARGEETVPEMCTLCGKEILCPFCGRPSDNGVALETDDPGAALTPQEEQEQVEKEKRERALSGAVPPQQQLRR